jgi:hypothetical protein
VPSTFTSSQQKPLVLVSEYFGFSYGFSAISKNFSIFSNTNVFVGSSYNLVKVVFSEIRVSAPESKRDRILVGNSVNKRSRDSLSIWGYRRLGCSTTARNHGVFVRS